jgi:hypothetical protein
MQQSAQRASAKTVRVSFPSFRELKDHLSNHVRHGVDLVLELKRLARHPIGHAHGFHDLRLKIIYQAARTPNVTHLRSPPGYRQAHILVFPRFGLRIRHTFQPAVRPRIELKLMGFIWAPMTRKTDGETEPMT